jgi:hypothetical protein
MNSLEKYLSKHPRGCSVHLENFITNKPLLCDCGLTNAYADYVAMVIKNDELRVKNDELRVELNIKQSDFHIAAESLARKIEAVKEAELLFEAMDLTIYPGVREWLLRHGSVKYV